MIAELVIRSDPTASLALISFIVVGIIGCLVWLWYLWWTQWECGICGKVTKECGCTRVYRDHRGGDE